MRHPSKISGGDVDWSKVKILVFSPDEAFRFMVRSTFRKLGVADVLSTGQVEDAEHLASHGPQLALIDLEGGGDGPLSFLARLKNAPRNAQPDLPILIAARGGSAAVPAQALNMGISGVVPKPVSGHELTIRVAQTLAAPQNVMPQKRMTPAPAPAPAPRPATARVAAAPRAPKPPAANLPAISERAPSLPATLPTPRPALSCGGKLGEDDLAGIAAEPQKARSYDLVEPVDGAKSKQAAARRAAWQEVLEQTGHHARTGADVAGFDVGVFVGAHVVWLQTQGADGQRANVQGMDLAGADLARTVLANATFREADLSDASLAEARLDGGDFRYAKLDAADMRGANLGVAQLRHAKMRLTNLEGAILRGADLSGADLRGALLAGADVKGAVMISTDLSGTDLSQVDNMSQAQADRAITDMKTKLPPGIRRQVLDPSA